MLKKHMVPLRKGGQLVKNRGKGAVEQSLPSRGAMNTLTQGDPGQRTFNNYAKATPGPEASTPDIQGLNDNDGDE